MHLSQRARLRILCRLNKVLKTLEQHMSLLDLYMTVLPVLYLRKTTEQSDIRCERRCEASPFHLETDQIYLESSEDQLTSVKSLYAVLYF